MVEFNDEGLSLPIDMGDGAATDADKPVVREVTAADMAALAEVEAELDQRWNETTIDPTLSRMELLMDLLGNPERSFATIHVAGTNGKTSTVRMIESLMRAFHRRTGRTTSPHLQLVTERIAIDGRPLHPQDYVRIWREIQPYVEMADAESVKQGGPRLSKFEVLTAMAYAAFADAPVDVAVVEVGLGGRWDATNVINADVAVITPIGLDHMDYLGDTIAEIAAEKAGIIKQRWDLDDLLTPPDNVAVIGEQDPAALTVVLERAVATDAAVALAAVEAFFGAGAGRSLDLDVVREGFAAVESPGRLERVRSAPTVFLDAAHNPHGARALAQALERDFDFTRLVGVVSVLGDKDVRGILRELEPCLHELVVTQNTSPRVLPAEELADIAREIFGEERVHVAQDLPGAVELAVELAEDTEVQSGAGVIITGSVVTAGEARTLFGKEPA